MLNSANLAKLPHSRETYFFCHIPKTAGSTIVNVLDDLFYQEEICPVYYTLELRDYTPEQLSKYRFFRGHLNYYMLNQFLEKPPKTFTFLRNPVDHAISIFAHQKRKSDQDFIDDEIKRIRQMSLEDYAYNPDIVINLDYGNLQIRTLIDKVRARHMNRYEVREFTEQSSLTGIEQAKKLLSEFLFVGISERMEESLLLAAYVLGIKPIESIPHLNVSENRPAADPHVYEKIASTSALDMEMYAFSQELFNQRYTAMMRDLLERYGDRSHAHLTLPLSKEVIKELLKKHYVARFKERYSPVKAFEYQFDQPLVGTGWYNREVNPDHGVYRWSGPHNMATLDFPLAAGSDLKIKLEILMALSQSVLDTLELEIEGARIPLKLSQNPSGTLTYEGVIPAAVLAQAGGLAPLALKVKETLTPGSVYLGNPDKRRLGFALKKVEITPL